MSVNEAIKELIENLSMEIVMADKNDGAALTPILKKLNPLILIPLNPSLVNQTRILSAAAVMHSYAKKAEESGNGSIEKALDVLSRAAAAMQVIADGNQPSEAAFPPELGLQETKEMPLKTEFASLYLSLKNLSLKAKTAGKKETAAAAALFAVIIEKLSNAEALQNEELLISMEAWSGAEMELAGKSMPMPKTQEQSSTVHSPLSTVHPEASEQAGLNTDPALLAEFVTEAMEHAESAEKNMLRLEKEKGDKEALNAVFRVFHTLKSLSGFFGLDEIYLLVKETESLLSKIRKGELAISETLMELLFKSVDYLKKMTANVSASLKNNTEIAREAGLFGHVQEIKYTAERKPSVLSAVSEACLVNTAKDAKPQAQAAAMKETVKIDSQKLDRLIDTIGEIVIAESMINAGAESAASASGGYFKNLSHLNKTTRRLHELGLALRLMPLAAVMQKMERIVRDQARLHNKKINFTASGGETEIDRSVVEKLQDPLVHMLRNAVDHGIERTGEDRKKAGKPETAEIRINAFHRGGNVVIEVSDDGKGLNRDRILAAGIENGLIEKGKIPADQDIYDLIFKPGFSTAAVVTDTSGRGVGMDVVKRNIEALRGRVDIMTIKGEGTKFSISLPITTAIIEVIVARLNDEKYMIPALSIVESVRPSYGSIMTVAGKGLMIKLRGSLVPVFSLNKLFYGKKKEKEDAVGQTVVVVEDNNKRAGILVDELVDRQQIVVKSLSNGMENIPGIAGCTIMSDGKVGLIIDAAEVIKNATREKEEAIV